MKSYKLTFSLHFASDLFQYPCAVADLRIMITKDVAPLDRNWGYRQLSSGFVSKEIILS